jgi:hypothetical protein
MVHHHSDILCQDHFWFHLEKILQDTTYAVERLATALPAQASYFIQVILVQNVLGLGTELLRVSALISSLLRQVLGKLMGRDLTNKEQKSALFGQWRFSDPSEYMFGRGETTLIFMVLFVYGCMSPIACYFTLFLFLLLAMGYRQQFVHVYTIANDSGSRLYENFVKVCITSMIIAEVVLVVVVGSVDSRDDLVQYVPPEATLSCDEIFGHGRLCQSR